MSKPTPKRSIDRETLRLFWQASRHTKKSLIFRTVLYSVAVILLGTVVPLFIGKLLAALGRSGTHTDFYFWGFVVAGVLGFLGNRYGFTGYLQYQAYTMQRLQARGMEALLRRSVGFHNNNVGGKLVSDAIDFPSGFGMFSNTVISQLVPLVLILTSGVIVVFVESWILGTVVLAMVVVAVGTALSESRRRSSLRARRLIATKNLTSHLADTILNVQTVKTFAHEDQELQRHNALSDKLLRMRLRDWTKAAINGSNRIAAILVAQGVFAYTVIKLVQHDPNLLAIGIFAFSLTVTISMRLFDLNSMIRNLEDGFLLASSMTEVLLDEPEILDRPDAKTLRVTQASITLDHVDFHYQDSASKKGVFKNLQLDISPGEKIGLVGPSGGGKSTLTRLLLRFEDIDGGTISIDGQDIAGVTQGSLRQHISYVPQEPLLFHRPVNENIAYGLSHATPTMIKQAAQAANADDFIQALPEGYQTIVGERGVKLSGGQRQRIAIARAILKDAPILILDEATSALDSESEVLIQEALWKLMEQRTAIVIAHRLSTIQKMDRIIVLDGGAIVEQGTHKQLLKHKGLYAKLWAHQSGGFIEES